MCTEHVYLCGRLYGNRLFLRGKVVLICINMLFGEVRVCFCIINLVVYQLAFYKF